MRRSTERSGFTLAELAVTILIVGVTLVSLIQALNGAKLNAAHSRNLKVANQLAEYTLGQIESGLFQDDYGDRPSGTYADEGYEYFAFDVIYGEDSFPSATSSSSDGRRDWHDSFEARRLEQEEERDEEDREDEDLPFEKIKVRVTFPKLRDFKNELILERWMPWEQVYGSEEDEDGANR